MSMPLGSRQVWIHLGVLAASTAAAVGMWTRDKQPQAIAAGDVVVWSGHGADVQKVTYESKAKTVLLEAKSDAEGRYFTGSIDREGFAPPAHDGGAAPPPPRTTTGFVSVGPGEKLAEALGSLKALRALGKIGDDRAAEFGLAEPEATVTVRVGGVEHKLLLGATTPGGGDRYAKDGATGEVYALRGEPLRQIRVGRLAPHRARAARVEGRGRDERAHRGRRQGA